MVWFLLTLRRQLIDVKLFDPALSGHKLVSCYFLLLLFLLFCIALHCVGSPDKLSTNSSDGLAFSHPEAFTIFQMTVTSTTRGSQSLLNRFLLGSEASECP